MNNSKDNNIFIEPIKQNTVTLYRLHQKCNNKILKLENTIKAKQKFNKKKGLQANKIYLAKFLFINGSAFKYLRKNYRKVIFML